MLERNVRRITSIFLLLLSPLVLPAEASPPLRIRLAQEPDTIWPHATGMAIARDVARLVHAGLWRRDEQGGWEPDLAEGLPTLRREGVLWRARIRLSAGRRWHDGRPVVAEDLAATWRYLADPGRSKVLDRSVLDHVRGVEVLGDRVARITLDRPVAAWPTAFEAVYPAHLLRDTETWRRTERQPVGAGSYRLVSWEPGMRIRLQRVGPAGPADLSLQVIPDDGAAVVALLAGDLDILPGIPAPLLSRVTSVAGVVIRRAPSTFLEAVVWDVRHPVLSQRVVRTALGLVVDRERLVRDAWAGGALPARSDRVTGAGTAGLMWPVRPDAASARRLLESAGWRTGPDGVRRKNGRVLSFTLHMPLGRRSRESTAMALRAMWKALGADVKLQILHPSQFFAVQGPLSRPGFGAALWSWEQDADGDVRNMWRSDRLPPRGGNVSGLQDPVLDQLLDRVATTPETGLRQTLLERVSRRLREGEVLLPLVVPLQVWACPKDLQGCGPRRWSALGNPWNWRSSSSD